MPSAKTSRIMKLHRSFSTLGCPEASLHEALHLAHKYQVESIEIRALESTLDLPRALSGSFGTVELAKKERENLSPPINSLNSSCRLLGQSIQDCQELVELANWAEALGVKHIRVFDGEPTQTPITPSALKWANRFFDWWNQEKVKNHWNVDVLVETHSTLTTSTRILQFQDALKQPAHILWDAYHTWACGQEDPIVTWRNIRPWVRHIHIKDGTANKAAYTLPGRGDFPLSKLLAELKRSRFNGPVSLEWERYWHTELPPLTEAIKACQQIGW